MRISTYDFLPYLYRGKAFALEHRRYWPVAGGVLILLLIYGISKATEGSSYLVIERNPNFSDSKILSSSSDSVVAGREGLLDRKASQMVKNQEEIQQRLDALTEKIARFETQPTAVPEVSPTPAIDGESQSNSASTQLPQNPSTLPNGGHSSGYSSRLLGSPPLRRAGPDMISFPVKGTKTNVEANVGIPAGSYVKGKLLTGVEAPEGKTYPVLLQLDYALILPNQQRLDLSGCFMIVKATGNLSIERVEMQASKLSCVAKNGEMFERDVNGFIADDKDNSFALVGSVNTKQQRVATVAFLASIVDGVGRAIQQAQTTQQTTALGGAQSVLTGDQMKYIGAGGAATAANMVAQWYLKQAQNLLPTINVGSGRDVWIVMQEMVKLPNNYFQKAMKGESGENLYSYFTRVLR